MLYNLHRAKEAMRKEDRAILVEGYMDAIGVTAAGFGPVVASCGTALTAQQVKLLKQHTPRIVVNFDPDTAGANAAERSINMLLEEGMQVRILELDGDLDPDEYCKERGAGAYQERLEGAKGYFYWLADRARAKYDVRTSEGQVSVLKFLHAGGAADFRPDGAHGDRGRSWRATSAWIAAWCWTVSRRRWRSGRRRHFSGRRWSLRHDERILINALLTQPRTARRAIVPELKAMEIVSTFPRGGFFRRCSRWRQAADAGFRGAARAAGRGRPAPARAGGAG